MSTLSDFFLGSPSWNRPTHEANRLAIVGGTSSSVTVPNTSTRVVIEMWGQGGGGSPGVCCNNGCTGGQGGTYGSKVFELTQSPLSRGQPMLFCGCACACDCRAVGSSNGSGFAECGHPGQFTRLTNCTTTGSAPVASWIGCATGGAAGQAFTTNNLSWTCAASGCVGFNTNSDTGCISLSGSRPTTLAITNMSTAQNSACTGGSSACCAGSACYTAATLTSNTCVGTQHSVVDIAVPTPPISGIDGVFTPVNCACFDNYRLGACGWSKVSPLLGYNVTWNHCDIGVGGASWGGGAQQKQNGSIGNLAACGFAGNFPGGGGKSSGACGGGCCVGSIGGAGLILISWA